MDMGGVPLSANRGVPEEHYGSGRLTSPTGVSKDALVDGAPLLIEHPTGAGDLPLLQHRGGLVHIGGHDQARVAGIEAELVAGSVIGGRPLGIASSGDTSGESSGFASRAFRPEPNSPVSSPGDQEKAMNGKSISV
ncbi:hypothetical protein CDV55_101945 [Aspergillus turcosus]|nr:hypothetical protein CDV55_101945 [Aspergillus turcosus]